MELLQALFAEMLAAKELNQESAHYNGDDILEKIIQYFLDTHATDKEKAIIVQILQEREKQARYWWWA